MYTPDKKVIAGIKRDIERVTEAIANTEERIANYRAWQPIFEQAGDPQTGAYYVGLIPGEERRLADHREYLAKKEQELIDWTI